jgi:hypothetical protein
VAATDPVTVTVAMVTMALLPTGVTVPLWLTSLTV